MLLELQDVSFSYMHNTALTRQALKGINFILTDGEFVGLIGPTGSGKSTLIQHFNGLLSPTQGKVLIEGKELGREISPRSVRKIVGLVFQFPENQLFAETVFDDVAFGPRNLGFSEAETKREVKEALRIVGLNAEHFKDRSPFSLSGGEMRKVAIAGVLAMKPKILVLDEPTAGLDALGRQEILSYLKYLHQKMGLTIVLVSHNMDEVASLATRIVILNEGETISSGEPKEVFFEAEKLRQVGLDIPQSAALLLALKEKGIDIQTNSFALEETKEIILKHFR